MHWVWGWVEMMKAIDFLKSQRDDTSCFPHTKEAPTGKPSNAEVRRWLTKGSVVINGKRPGPGDEVEWPIRKLVYFLGTRSQVTVVDEDWVVG